MDETNINILHTGVKDFLNYLNYTDTLLAYQKELEHRDATLEPNPPPVAGDGDVEEARDGLKGSFLAGDSGQFWSLWIKNIPENIREEDSTQRLEFKLRLYFAVSPLINVESDNKDALASSMAEFKTYLETNGAGLSHTTEFVAYYALPYVPSPRKHQTFKGR